MGMTRDFYGDLLIAQIGNDEKYVGELLNKLSEDELQDLSSACQIIARLAREVWYNLPEPEKDDRYINS